MKVSLTWLIDIEVKSFGDKVETNKYFATVCCYIFGILGAWGSVAGFINDIFETEIEATGVTFIPLFTILALINICESLLSCKTWWTSIMRALMVLFSFAALYLVGVIVGMILCIAILIWVGFSLLSGALSAGFSGGGSNGSSSEDEGGESINLMNGQRISGRSSLDGETFYGNNGKVYRRSGMGSKSIDEI